MCQIWCLYAQVKDSNGILNIAALIDEYFQKIIYFYNCYWFIYNLVYELLA